MGLLNESNVYKIDYDKEYFYLNFARTEKVKEKVEDKDVFEKKEIKISAKFLSSLISGLIDKLEQYEQEIKEQSKVSEDNV